MRTAFVPLLLVCASCHGFDKKTRLQQQRPIRYPFRPNPSHGFRRNVDHHSDDLRGNDEGNDDDDYRNREAEQPQDIRTTPQNLKSLLARSVSVAGGIASKWLSRDSVEAMKSVRRIITTLPEYGFEYDIFNNHTPQEIVMSIYTLARLQQAAQIHERSHMQLQECQQVPLLEELLYYSRFAAAVYGWALDLVTGGKFHRGDLQALIAMTGVSEQDIVKVNSEAKVSVPAYFIARDHRHKAIVLSIRGTRSANDVLADLCCETVDFAIGNTAHRAHRGMLEGARGIQNETEYLLQSELDDHPGYTLKVVGHSLGGSVAAVLGQLLSHSLSRPVSVYTYGAACVAQPTEYDDVTIYSVLNEGDPFSCISLGHFADITAALSELCEKPDLRSTILIRTDGPLQQLDQQDLEWCAETMNTIRQRMKGEKLYPPGRLLYMSRHKPSSQFRLQDVPPHFFDQLVIGPRMFDFGQHVPRLYESRLRSCLEGARRRQ